jgi:hypothetical protein
MSALRKICRRSGVATWWIGCAAAVTVLTIATYCELQRVQQGKLFLFALPGEAPATLGELVDAEDSVRMLLTPALLCCLVMGAAFAFGVPHLRARLRFRAMPWWLTTAFLLACAADFITTTKFFATAGVDHELHPGIRLFGYAYGRTVGAAIGKVLQVVGLLALSVFMGQWGAYLIALATMLCTAAALYNFVQA